jgi:hypothetical protein
MIMFVQPINDKAMTLTINPEARTVTINGDTFTEIDTDVCYDVAAVITKTDNVAFPYAFVRARIDLEIVQECETCGRVIEFSERNLHGGVALCPRCKQHAEENEAGYPENSRY